MALRQLFWRLWLLSAVLLPPATIESVQDGVYFRNGLKDSSSAVLLAVNEANRYNLAGGDNLEIYSGNITYVDAVCDPAAALAYAVAISTKVDSILMASCSDALILASQHVHIPI